MPAQIVVWDGTAWLVANQSTVSGREALQAGTYKPSASTTGLLPGVTRSNYTGNVTFTSDGQTVQNMNINGSVDFNGRSGCTLRNCLVLEPTAREMPGTWRYGVRQFGANALNTVVEDCEIRPATPGENHGYAYWGYLNAGTFRRNNVSGFIDGCNVSGLPGSIVQNWFHDSEYWDPHTGWSDGVSHNDAIQMSNASNWTIRGNTFAWAQGGASNILITRGSGPTSGNVIDRNWFDSGAVAVNIGTDGVEAGVLTNNLAGERPAFRTTIHLLAPATWVAATAPTGNLTYSGASWFVYNP